MIFAMYQMKNKECNVPCPKSNQTKFFVKFNVFIEIHLLKWHCLNLSSKSKQQTLNVKIESSKCHIRNIHNMLNRHQITNKNRFNSSQFLCARIQKHFFSHGQQRHMRNIWITIPLVCNTMMHVMSVFPPSGTDSSNQISINNTN